MADFAGFRARVRLDMLMLRRRIGENGGGEQNERQEEQRDT
jgi:hypothetical protein